MSIPLILICGCTEYKRKINQSKAPQNLVDQINSQGEAGYYCIPCRQLNQAAIYQSVYWYTFFCIPIFPYHWSKPYIGCQQCKNPVQHGTEAKFCSNCGHWISDIGGEKHLFCQHCGEQVLTFKQ